MMSGAVIRMKGIICRRERNRTETTSTLSWYKWYYTLGQYVSQRRKTPTLEMLRALHYHAEENMQRSGDQGENDNKMNDTK